jgi:hypothetical protein
VAGHQHQPSRPGQLHQVSRLRDARGQRLLHQHVLVREERVARDRVVRVDRGGDHDRVDAGRQQLMVVGEEPDPWIPGGDIVEPLGSPVRDGQQLRVRHLVQVADQVRAPIAAADHADTNPRLAVRQAGRPGLVHNARHSLPPGSSPAARGRK